MGIIPIPRACCKTSVINAPHPHFGIMNQAYTQYHIAKTAMEKMLIDAMLDAEQSRWTMLCLPKEAMIKLERQECLWGDGRS